MDNDREREPEDWKGTLAYEGKDGYRIERLMPGFRVTRGREHLGTVYGWRDAVHLVLVERDARKAIRKN